MSTFASSKVLKVSKSGYYASIDRPPSRRAERTAKIEASVAQVFEETDSIYGSAKIAEELAEREDLETACRTTVVTAMKRLGLWSKVKKAFRPTTTKSDPSKQPAPNLLDRCFEADGPNRKWVTNITYLPTLEGWVYLAGARGPRRRLAECVQLHRDLLQSTSPTPGPRL